MRPLSRWLPALFLLLSIRSLGAVSCNDTAPREGSRFEVGLSIESLLPNQLPDFPSTVPVYGLLIGIPVFGHSLEAEGLYGANNGVTFYTGELAYRYEIETPFFIPFVLVGGHFSHYSYSGGSNHDFYGPLLGLGFLIPMGGSFDLSLLMKTYLPNLGVLGFGGGFSLRL